MRLKQTGSLILILIFAFLWSPTPEIQAQNQDRPIMNLLGNILEDGLKDAAEAIQNPPPPVPGEAPAILTPDLAYRQLVAGNARYTKNDTRDADSVPPLSSDPNAPPAATIFFSPEMRTTPDIVLDVAPNNLYLVPVRASVFTSEELDDLEYGVVNLRSPLVVVLTHAPSQEIARLLSAWPTLSDAAKRQVAESGTFFSGNNVRPNSDDELLYSLAGPAVARAQAAYPDLSIHDAVRIVAESIAWQSVEAMLMQSSSLRQLVAGGQTDLVAAVLDEETGEIEWLGRHPLTDEFLKTVPQDVVTRYGAGNVADTDLPAALDPSTVERYLADDVANKYYVNVTNEYYYRPAPSVPSWNLFRPDIWEYRPWFGVWVRPFAPLPSYHPWQYGPARHYPYWQPGHPNFFIGFNWGLDYHHIAPDFRPHDPRWNQPFFLDPRKAPGWQPGSPWDEIWNRGPHPDWRPQPNGYHGPVGPGGPWRDDWNPGDHHPGWDHPDKNPHRNDPDWKNHDQPGWGRPGDDRPGGQGGNHGGHGRPGNDQPDDHGGPGNDQPGGHGRPTGNDQPGGQGGIGGGAFPGNNQHGGHGGRPTGNDQPGGQGGIGGGAFPGNNQHGGHGGRPTGDDQPGGQTQGGGDDGGFDLWHSIHRHGRPTGNEGDNQPGGQGGIGSGAAPGNGPNGGGNGGTDVWGAIRRGTLQKPASDGNEGPSAPRVSPRRGGIQGTTEEAPHRQTMHGTPVEERNPEPQITPRFGGFHNNNGGVGTRSSETGPAENSPNIQIGGGVRPSSPAAVSHSGGTAHNTPEHKPNVRLPGGTNGPRHPMIRH